MKLRSGPPGLSSPRQGHLGVAPLNFNLNLVGCEERLAPTKFASARVDLPGFRLENLFPESVEITCQVPPLIVLSPPA
jgi:hypothetical protein